jgi:hypothetical protein
MFTLSQRIAQVWAAFFGPLPSRRAVPRSAPPRLRLERLSDRTLFSVDLLAGLPYTSLPLNQSALSVVSRVETYVLTGGNAESAKQTSPGDPGSQAEAVKDSIRSSLSALAPPVVVAGELTVAAENFPILDFQFGSTAEVVFVFRQPGAAAPQSSGDGLNSDLLGAGVAVRTQAGDERYFLDFDHFGANTINARFASERYAAAYSTVAPGPSEARATDGSDEITGLGRDSSPGTRAGAEAFDPSRPDRREGARIADGLAQPEGDSDQKPSDESEKGEVDSEGPDGETTALVMVDWNLPDANEELVPLQKAKLAVVPTFVVGEGRVPAAAAAATDDHQDLSLSVVVVGLEEAPFAVRPTAVEAAADHLFLALPFPAQGDWFGSAPADGPSSRSGDGATPSGAAGPVGTCPGRLLSQYEQMLAELPHPEARETAAQAVATALLTFGLWRLTNPSGRAAK